MSRLNPKRRLLKKLAEYALAHETATAINVRMDNPSTVAHTGNIRSASGKLHNLVPAYYRAPSGMWEGSPKLGKIVKGAFKAARPAKKRFTKS